MSEKMVGNYLLVNHIEDIKRMCKTWKYKERIKTMVGLEIKENYNEWEFSTEFSCLYDWLKIVI